MWPNVTNIYNNFFATPVANNPNQNSGGFENIVNVFNNFLGEPSGFGSFQDIFNSFIQLSGSSQPHTPQPIYGYPNANAALMPNHLLYPMISDHYNLIAKYSSPQYGQLQQGGNYGNPFTTSYSPNPIDWMVNLMMGSSYYQNGIPGTY